MRLSIHWFNQPNSDIITALQGVLLSAHKNIFSEIKIHAATNLNGVLPLLKAEEPPYQFEAINQIYLALKDGLAQEMDFVIVNFGHAFVLSLPKLKFFLESDAVQNSILSARINDIGGVGFKFSAKLPYIDENFLIFNIKKVRETDFIKRHFIKACHFAPIGRHHALLISFIETSLKKSEVNNYHINDDLINERGSLIHSGFLPFRLSLSKGFLVCYTLFNKRLNHLIYANYQSQALVALEDIKGAQKQNFARLQSVDGFYVFKHSKIFQIALKLFTKLRRLYSKTYRKKEFQRDFSDWK